ncbi:hypothetical protein [Calothrix rhizosoleniae]|nr:hypothetical protein [Calothrix rhizosoleniae]
MTPCIININSYSSITHRVTFIDADIENSMILQDVQVIGIQRRIMDSVIG